MSRKGFVLFCLAIIACNNKNSDEKEQSGFSYQSFSKKFHTSSPPYQLSELALLKAPDTAIIKSSDLAGFISDSLKARLFGSSSRVRYFPVISFQKPKSETYYIIKATGNNKRAALLLIFDREQQFGSILPFLVPDNDPGTSQNSLIDKSFSISRITTLKKPNGITAEGKDVYVYNPASRSFSLVMTNPLYESNQDVINPIDSLTHKHKLAGDYVRNKKNFISVRDGRHPNQLMVFIHLENADGECTGELKGNVLLTSPTTAIYRQGGDPCVLSLRFASSSVTLKEDEGCGSHRGVNCVFEGTFQRKKEVKPRSRSKSRKAFNK